MKIVAGLWVTLMVMVAAMVAFFVLAIKRNWFHWHRCVVDTVNTSGMISTR